MYNPDRLDSENGIAYGWLALSIFLVLAGILYSYLSGGMVNALINGPDGTQGMGINHDIKAGKQSTQSVNAIQFNIDMAKNIPMMVIVGAFLWAVSRAITVKPGG